MFEPHILLHNFSIYNNGVWKLMPLLSSLKMFFGSIKKRGQGSFEFY